MKCIIHNLVINLIALFGKCLLKDRSGSEEKNTAALFLLLSFSRNHWYSTCGVVTWREVEQHVIHNNIMSTMYAIDSIYSISHGVIVTDEMKVGFRGDRQTFFFFIKRHKAQVVWVGGEEEG